MDAVNRTEKVGASIEDGAKPWQINRFEGLFAVLATGAVLGGIYLLGLAVIPSLARGFAVWARF